MARRFEDPLSTQKQLRLTHTPHQRERERHAYIAFIQDPTTQYTALHVHTVLVGRLFLASRSL